MKTKKQKKFGKIAVKTVSLLKSQSNLTPEEAWNKTTDEIFEDKKSMKQKGCPKNTFLGLFEEGLIKEFPIGNYTRSKKNKEYGLKGIKVLKQNPNIKTEKELWNEVIKNEEKNISHNNQMDVVLALWENNLINIDKI